MNRHPLLRLVVAAALLPSLPAAAEVYRCQRDGQTVFTDQPCGGEPLELSAPTIIAPEDDGLARAHDERVRHGRERRQAADAEWLEQHAERRAREERIRSARLARVAVEGMTAADVRQALGAPDQVTAGDGGERWTYRLEGGSRQVVSFRDGQVSSVRTSATSRKRR